MDIMPEETFLEKDPNIDPITMSAEVVSRTHGLTTTLRDSLMSREGFSKKAAEATLWQIESNLIILDKILNNWHEVHDEMAASIKSLTSREIHDG